MTAGGRSALHLEGIERTFPGHQPPVTALHGIDLTVEPGEWLAIIGPSGSGKSTLLNILGCLDRPTSGHYRVGGVDAASLDADALAALRREHFGFVFQGYRLLADRTAIGNVEVPAIYAGTPHRLRRPRALALLERLGLADRADHVPAKLSGGQQQRVAVARALMNGGDIILADEPTGALDTQGGAELLDLLAELNAAGHTLIVVTHSPAVAERAHRVVELRDGRIVSDRRRDPAPLAGVAGPEASLGVAHDRSAASRAGLGAWFGRFAEALRMATASLRAHRLRSALTMLGIVIGIASVVSIVALGEGSQRAILSNISAIGTNTIDVMAGSGMGDLRAGAVETLVPGDADALAGQPYVDSVTPNVGAAVTLRHGNVAAAAMTSGVGERYFRVKDLRLSSGRTFDAAEVAGRAQLAVIDAATRKKLFADGRDPIGEVILLGRVPVRVIGVIREKGGFGPPSDNLHIFLPYTTALARLGGSTSLRSLTVRVSDEVPMAAAEQAVTQLLEARHGRRDFFVVNTDSIRQTIESTTGLLTLLVSSIAVISLIVGGIGVMNIMLVSVSERTREIGVHMAVGARQRDIQQQFLIEAVLVCLVGGTVGLLLAVLFGVAFGRVVDSVQLVVSTESMAAAVLCSTFIGIVFGFVPARNAARLDPVVALARE